RLDQARAVALHRHYFERKTLMRTLEIGGICQPYEACCQRMLQNGIAFLKAHPKFSFKGLSLFNLPKDFDSAVIGSEKGVSGAQMGAVCSHLAYIHKNGIEEWLSKGPKTRQFEFDGTVESCP